MTRKPRNAQFKSQVALEALKNQKTVNELAAEYEIHPNMISKWKKQRLEGLPSIFADGRTKAVQNDEALQGPTLNSPKIGLDFGVHFTFLSVVSAWEIALLYKRNRLRLPLEPGLYLDRMIKQHALIEVPLSRHMAHLSVRLPNIHNDPFDRILIAMCQTNE